MTKDYKAASRYAYSFFLLSKQKRTLSGVHDELYEVLRFLKAHPELSRLLLTATIAYEEKEALIDSLLSYQEEEKYGKKTIASVETRDFIKLLVDKKRFSLFEKIVDEFHRHYNLDQGVEEARVVTAFRLDERQSGELKLSLENKFQKKVILTNEIDPELIGGLIVYTRDQVIDGSLREKLQSLKKALLSTDSKDRV